MTKYLKIQEAFLPRQVMLVPSFRYNSIFDMTNFLVNQICKIKFYYEKLTNSDKDKIIELQSCFLN